MYSPCHYSSALHAQSQRYKRTRRSKINAHSADWLMRIFVNELAPPHAGEVRAAVPKNFGIYCTIFTKFNMIWCKSIPVPYPKSCTPCKAPYQNPPFFFLIHSLYTNTLFDSKTFKPTLFQNFSNQPLLKRALHTIETEYYKFIIKKKNNENAW